MAVDPTTLNPTPRVDQFTTFVLMPICVRCGYGGFSRRKDGSFRCDGCHRRVTLVEFAPEVLSKSPLRLLKGGG